MDERKVYEYVNKIANDEKEINIVGIHFHLINAVVLLKIVSMRETEW